MNGPPSRYRPSPIIERLWTQVQGLISSTWRPAAPAELLEIVMIVGHHVVAVRGEEYKRGGDDIRQTSTAEQYTCRTPEVLVDRNDIDTLECLREARLTCATTPDLSEDSGVGDRHLAAGPAPPSAGSTCAAHLARERSTRRCRARRSRRRRSGSAGHAVGQRSPATDHDSVVAISPPLRLQLLGRDLAELRLVARDRVTELLKLPIPVRPVGHSRAHPSTQRICLARSDRARQPRPAQDRPSP